jgi:hypothetical protein
MKRHTGRTDSKPAAAMKKIALAGCVAGGGVAALVLFLLDPDRVPLYPVCTFHRLTGLECPGCGSLRALHQLLHGHLIAALCLNAFVILSLPVFAWVAFRWVRCRLKNEPQIAIRPVWLWLYLAAFIAFGILRVLPVALFTSSPP